MSIIRGRSYESEQDGFEPTAVRPGFLYEEHIQKVYGLTLADFQTIFREQDGRCAICREDVILEVDHDHVDGHVRGLLCHRCNLRIERPEGWVFGPRVPTYLAARAPKVQVRRLTPG